MSVWADGWRLSVGTLTALPVRPPVTVDRRRAGIAIALAPVTALLLAVPAAAVLWAGQRLGAPGPLIGVVVVAVLGLGSRGLHLDGLADTADGLAAPKDADGRLAVMRRGDVGPVGATALVLVILAQVMGVASLAPSLGGSTVLLAAVCASRCALGVVCLRGVPAARGDGLGAAVAGSVPRTVAVTSWLLLGSALVLATQWWSDTYTTITSITSGLPYRAGDTTTGYGSSVSLTFDSGAGIELQAVVTAVVAVAAVALLVRRAVRTLGGVTGDVCGAGVEIALAVLLVGLVV